MGPASIATQAQTPDRHAKRTLYFAIAFGVLLLDQLTKWLVDRSLTLHDSIAVLPGLFSLTHVENQGAAFGLFADSPAEWRAATLIIFSAVALVVVSILLWRNSHSFTFGGVALALILGGAVGNLWDRVFQGHVVDFLDFYISTHHWPAFNVADSAIVVGALLLVSEILFAENQEGLPAKAAGPAQGRP
jgi:signal peptidase II